MRLAEYLTAQKISDAEFGIAIGVTRQAVHRYKSGDRVPDRKTMERVTTATQGAVTANDFFGIAAAPAPERESAA